MVGTPQTWVNTDAGGTPMSAARLNDIESRITAAAASSDLNAHIAASAAHGATGAVVGTTNTQTLSNKTMDAAVLTGTTTAPTPTGTNQVATKGYVDGGYRPGGTDVAVADGGTGASTASAARTNLGMGAVDNTADADKPLSGPQGTAISTALLDYAPIQDSRVVVTTNYSVGLDDSLGVVLWCTAAGAVTVTLPSNATAAIPLDRPIRWRQEGAGQITFAAGSGATIRGKGGALKSNGQDSEGFLVKVATNAWRLYGDITT